MFNFICTQSNQAHNTKSPVFKYSPIFVGRDTQHELVGSRIIRYLLPVLHPYRIIM